MVSESDATCAACGAIYAVRSQPVQASITTEIVCLVCGGAVRSITDKKAIQYALKVPPRRITLEHEAAHIVVGHVGKATVNHVDLAINHSSDAVQLAHASWSPSGTDMNAISLAFAAGPAQTGITAKRMGFRAYVAEKAVDAEGAGFAAQFRSDRSKGISYIRAYLPAAQTFLETAEVQAAVQVIADHLEAAEGAGRTRIDWAEIESLIDWSKLPPLPRI